tara:strand:- start:31614 stop:32354 length:741 start_codon:yes stop_codon:yes gene_type:complete
MKLRKSERKRVKIRLGIQGPSGSGKTYGALLVAYGICNDWSKIAIIDTESNSADLYAHLGEYNVLSMSQPYSPESYIGAIEICEKAGIEVIIIDSISHEWEGIGGILDTHGKMTGNSFTNWSKLAPRHNNLVGHILSNPCHMIVTIRSKQDYILTERNGKMIPQKVGMKAITRDGLDYEMTLMFDLDANQYVKVTKDRTSHFKNRPEFKLSIGVGKSIVKWCNELQVKNHDTKPANSTTHKLGASN